MYVRLCAVSPVASCSHGQVVRLTSEPGNPSSNPTQCSFFCSFFLSLYTSNLLTRTDIHVCAAELATWGVGPDVKKKEQCHPTPKELSLSWSKKKMKEKQGIN